MKRKCAECWTEVEEFFVIPTDDQASDTDSDDLSEAELIAGGAVVLCVLCLNEIEEEGGL
jgi:hypothetical protein